MENPSKHILLTTHKIKNCAADKIITGYLMRSGKISSFKLCHLQGTVLIVYHVSVHLSVTIDLSICIFREGLSL